MAVFLSFIQKWFHVIHLGLVAFIRKTQISSLLVKKKKAFNQCFYSPLRSQRQHQPQGILFLIKQDASGTFVD